MANLIQIKRSTTTATPVSLANGEMAITSNGDVLFIGSNGAVLPVGGKRTPGTLTANQALVANATSGIDKVIVANLVPTNVWANGAAGSGGQVLTSNSIGGVYWSTPSAGVAGADTQIQFNDGGALAGDSGLTYNKTSDTLSTNTVLATSTVNAATLSVGSSTVANSTGLWTTGTVNAATLQVGTSVVANSTKLVIGTAVGLQVNGTIGTAGQILYSNGTTGYWAAPPTGDITAVTAGSGLTGGGTSGDVTLDVGAGNGITVAADAISVDGANGISVDASGVNVLAGTNGGLSVNSTGVWVVTGNGLLANATGLHVGAANGVTISADAIAVTEGVGLLVNATGVNVKANNGIIANSTGTFVNANTSSGLIANATGVHAKVSTTVILDGSGNLAVNSAALSFTDLTVSGNLTVLGDLVSLNVATLAIEDPLIVLAKDQSNSATYTDAVDIGFYGSYGNTQVGNNKWTGLFRDQSDSGIFKLFDGAIPAPTTTVDTANVNFAYATLQSYLKSGALVSNATSVYITSNSTVNVNITANTLALSTALPATSGGTGLASYTSGDIIVANTGNALSKLSLGTDGYVLQSNGTALIYNTLDGGSF